MVETTDTLYPMRLYHHAFDMSLYDLTPKYCHVAKKLLATESQAKAYPTCFGHKGFVVTAVVESQDKRKHETYISIRISILSL